MKSIYKQLICISIITILAGVNVSSAVRVDNKKSIVYQPGGKIESGFMIGIMHVKHIKKNWGWEEVWTPIYVIEYGPNGKEILKPSSGSFTPYDIDGLLGPAYSILKYPYMSGPFFICANVIVWEEN